MTRWLIAAAVVVFVPPLLVAATLWRAISYPERTEVER